MSIDRSAHSEVGISARRRSRAVALLEVARDARDQRRAFHCRQQMVEEALLVRLEG